MSVVAPSDRNNKIRPVWVGVRPHYGQRMLYLLWANDVLLYVGQSTQLGTRMRKQQETNDWWPQVTAIEVHGPYRNWRSISYAECVLIDQLAPLHNRPYAGQQRVSVGAMPLDQQRYLIGQVIR